MRGDTRSERESGVTNQELLFKAYEAFRGKFLKNYDDDDPTHIRWVSGYMAGYRAAQSESAP